MTTCTITQIIDKFAQVIRDLTPGSVSGSRFERAPTAWPLRTWAVEAGAHGAAWRKFEILWTGPRTDPGLLSPDAAYVQQEVTITVAYPARTVNVAGAEQLDDLADLVYADATQIRDAIFSPGNLTNGGHQASIVTILPPDRSNPDVWFQDFTVECKFFQSQTLT